MPWGDHVPGIGHNIGGVRPQVQAVFAGAAGGVRATAGPGGDIFSEGDIEVVLHAEDVSNADSRVDAQTSVHSDASSAGRLHFSARNTERTSSGTRLYILVLTDNLPILPRGTQAELTQPHVRRRLETTISVEVCFDIVPTFIPDQYIVNCFQLDRVECMAASTVIGERNRCHAAECSAQAASTKCLCKPSDSPVMDNATDCCRRRTPLAIDRRGPLLLQPLLLRTAVAQAKDQTSSSLCTGTGAKSNGYLIPYSPHIPCVLADTPGLL